MDTQGVTSRPIASSSTVSATSTSASAAPEAAATAATATGATAVASGSTTPPSTVETPATTHHLSGGGMFLNLLQTYEDKHPDEAKEYLSGVADKLRSDAKHAGFFSRALDHWADKFQKAADTGDLSNLLPRWQQPGHFGMRAYQQAAQPAGTDDAALGAIARASTPPASPAAAASGEPSAVASVNAPVTAAESTSAPAVPASTTAMSDVVVAQSGAAPTAASPAPAPITSPSSDGSYGSDKPVSAVI
jgi:hypothetical protein